MNTNARNETGTRAKLKLDTKSDLVFVLVRVQ